MQHDANKQLLPIGGNAWVENGGEITEDGLIDWTSPNTVCKVYLRPNKSGELKLSLLLNAEGSQSRIKVTVLQETKTIDVEGNKQKEFYVGAWNLNSAGYVMITIQGLSKTQASFGALYSLGISGTAIGKGSSFVANNKDDYFYWGRRGPSVHLNYDADGINNIEWFYNEVTVPAGNDVIGSYFMANGFGEGYFGIQVNSTTERRILFSVWSPYETDNPDNIPENQRIILLKKGEGVYTGAFGNEGSGGQSYLTYNWQAANTYKFLLSGKPVGNNYTVYTAYFFMPEANEWKLIARFKRPATSTYLKELHSFLENFSPETGNQTRTALYGNQWVADNKGNWTELTSALFTGDETARKNFRQDYAGGVIQGKFFLKNCGFFSDFVALDGTFERQPKNTPPAIDFNSLPE
jgi:hypothetical protein